MNNSEIAEEAFIKFIKVFESKAIQISSCTLFDDVYVYVDFPNKSPRFTYVMLEPQSHRVIAQCIIIFCSMDRKNRKKWQIGWYVAQDYREKGIAHELSDKALREFIYQLKPKLIGDYIEANVDEHNIASIKIANTLIGNCSELFDPKSNKKVYNFSKQIKG